MMKFNYNDFFDSDAYKFGVKIDHSDFSEALDYPSLISYRYIQLEDTDYHFSQSCLDNKDIIAYFRFMHMLSCVPFNILCSNKEKDWHLNSSPYRGNLKGLVDITINKGKTLKAECTPSFFHFALYTNENSSRKGNLKSPRIYFFIGDKATIYPLFYDPYHEINP